MPKPAVPRTLASESSRFRGFPITVQDARGFSSTVAGTGNCAAAAASSPKRARCEPQTTVPRSTRHDPGATFHCCAAACTSSVRARAPTCR